MRSRGKILKFAAATGNVANWAPRVKFSPRESREHAAHCVCSTRWPHREPATSETRSIAVRTTFPRLGPSDAVYMWILGRIPHTLGCREDILCCARSLTVSLSFTHVGRTGACHGNSIHSLSLPLFCAIVQVPYRRRICSIVCTNTQSQNIPVCVQ